MAAGLPVPQSRQSSPISEFQLLHSAFKFSLGSAKRCVHRSTVISLKKGLVWFVYFWDAHLCPSVCLRRVGQLLSLCTQIESRCVSTYFVSVLCRVLGNINYSPSRSSGGTKFNLPLGNTSPIIIAVCMHSLPFSRVSNVDFEKRVVSRILVRCIRWVLFNTTFSSVTDD